MSNKSRFFSPKAFIATLLFSLVSHATQKTSPTAGSLEVVEWAFPPATSLSLAQLFLAEPTLRSRVTVQGSKIDPEAILSSKCEAIALKPGRLDAAVKADDKSFLRCAVTSATGEALIRLSLASEMIESWGNRFDVGSFVLEGPLTSDLILILKRLDFHEEGALDLSYTCDPGFNYCIESYVIPANHSEEFAFAPVSCSRVSDFSDAARAEFKKRKMSADELQAYLQDPSSDGWIDRQVKSGVRSVREESCRFSQEKHAAQ